jgi:hypothetical protein
MLVTLEGIIISVSPLQPLNALSPIAVTLEGINIEDRPLQHQKAFSKIQVTLEGMVEFLHPTMRVLDDFSIIALQLSRES